MPRKLLLFPFGGNAREALLSVLALNTPVPRWDLVGFLDDNRALFGKGSCGVRVIGGREVIKEMPDAFVLALPGNPATFRHRGRMIQGLDVEPSRFATVIDPSAQVAPDARIGYNTIVMANVMISCGVRIGNHCIILPNTVVSHDSTVEDFCCIGSNVSVSGSVRIGTGCYIGSGSRVRDGLSIGAGTMVGLGATVVRDLGPGIVAAGNPARELRTVNG